MIRNLFTSFSKVAIMTILTTAITVTPVFAINGDLWKGTTKVGDIFSVLLDSSKFLDLVTNTTAYRYEVNGKGYSATEVDTMFRNNPTETAAQVQARISAQLTGNTLTEDPSTTEDVIVISVE